MTRRDSPSERARSLVSTSVDDLRSSLYFYEWNVKVDVETIRQGLLICEQRGEKTKASMLRRKLKGMEKNIATFEAAKKVGA